MTERWRAQVMGGGGFSVDRKGVVHSWTQDADGNREERQGQLCDSPVREIFPGWAWDLTMDPRDD